MARRTFTSPVGPGDPLWWASESADGGPGPRLVEARLSGNAVEGVRFDHDGIKIITDGGSEDEPGSQYACVDKASCLDWIRRNCPDGVLLDGRTIKAYHMDCDGAAGLTCLKATVSDIENLFHSSGLASTEFDADGHFAIYREDARKENSAVTTFLRDEAGNPVDVLYGEYLLVRAVRDEAAGMLVLCDVSDETAGASGPGAAYDPDFWTKASDMTVDTLKAFLDRFPGDAVLHCGGSGTVYWHFSPEGKTLSVGVDALAGLPEYEGREPAKA